MASFNDARAAATDIAVEAGARTGAVDQSVGLAITAFGQIAGDIRKGTIKGDIRDELEESANIIGTLNSELTQINDLEGPLQGGDAQRLDISQSDPSGVLDQASQKFHRLALARSQGKISQQRAQVEAEIILRAGINRAPSFASELRTFAANQLGFDPSGAVLGQLFLSGPDLTDPNRRLTTAEKIEDIAQGIAATSDIPLSTARKFASESLHAKNVQSVLAFETANGQAATPELANRWSVSLEKELGAHLVSQIGNIQATGQIEDFTAFINTSDQIFALQVSDARKAAANKRADFEEIERQMTNAYTLWKEVVNDQDLLVQLTRSNSLMEAIATEKSMLFAGPMLLFKGIPGGLELMGDLMIASNGDQSRFNDLVSMFPLVAGPLSNFNAAGLDLVQALTRVVRGGVSPASPTAGLDGVVAHAVIERGRQRRNGELYNSGISALVDLGKSQEATAEMAQTSDSIALLEPATIRKTQVMFPNDVDITVGKIAASLEAQPDIALVFDGNQFTTEVTGEILQSQQDALVRRGNVAFADIFSKGPIDREALKYLNKGLLGLVEQPGWTGTLGFSNVQDFALQVIDKVNTALDISINRADLDAGFGGEVIRDETAVTPILEPTLVQKADGTFSLINQGVETTPQDALKQDLFDTIKKAPNLQDFEPDIAIIVGREADRRGYDSRFVFSLSKAESAGDPNARANINFPESNASGLFQMQPGTFNDFLPAGATAATASPKLNEDIFNPVFNTQAALNHLDALFDKFGDQGLREVVIRWHDGLFSEGIDPTPAAITLADKVLKDLGINA